jgi:hypothetical protein
VARTLPSAGSVREEDSKVDDPLAAASRAPGGDDAETPPADLTRFVRLDPGLRLSAAEARKRPGLWLDDRCRHHIDRVLRSASRLETGKALPFRRELLCRAVGLSSLRSGSLCHGASTITPPVSSA